MSKKAEKAKMGRPVTVGATAYIPVKFPPSLVEKVDTWAKAEGVSRSAAVRQLTERGLKSKGRENSR